MKEIESRGGWGGGEGGGLVHLWHPTSNPPMTSGKFVYVSGKLEQKFNNVSTLWEKGDCKKSKMNI